MTRQSIAIDIDDVVVAHVDAFIEFSNKNYGTNYTIEDYVDTWAILWGIDDDTEIKRRQKKFHTPKSVMNYKFIEGAKDTIQRLAKEYDLYIVTARPEHIVDITNEWVEEHFCDVFKAVHFVPIWALNNKVTKGDICKQIGANYLIDDAIKHCNIAAESGVRSILFGDYAWNRDELLTDGVIRCKDWKEVAKLLLGKS
jgi:5'(3')-deoxyribonucleotidase